MAPCLERLEARRYKPYLVEREKCRRSACDSHVSVMNGIERSPQDSNAQTIYVGGPPTQVSLSPGVSG